MVAQKLKAERDAAFAALGDQWVKLTHGDVVIDELFTLWGTIGGNVTVVKNGKFYLRGELFGSMIVR